MKLTFFYPHRNAGTGGDGGGGYDPNGMGFRMRPTDIIKSGVGDKPLENVDEAAQKQKADEEARIKAEQEKNQNKPDPNKHKPAGSADAPEGKMYNEQGQLVDDPNFKKADPTIPVGKMKNDKGEIVDDPNYKKPEDNQNADDELSDEEFWGEVDKHTGIPVQVKYPDDIDPLSPQGVAVREAAVRKQERDIYDQQIREQFPHGYAYLLHHMQGKPDAEFFQPEKDIVLPAREAVEKSADLQKQLIVQDLKNKGVDQEIIDAQIAVYVKNNKLQEQGLKRYDDTAASREKELKLQEARIQESNKRADQAIGAMVTRIEKALPELGFVIPDADRKAVSEYIQDNLQYDRNTGQFRVVQDLNPDDLKFYLEALTFQYYKGDLSKVVNKKVSTKVAQRLRTNADRTKTSNTNRDDTRNDNPGFVPLGSLGNGVAK